jgi:DnaJ like chaperone protein
MSMWGKIIGGVAGLALGGPFGAVLGAALGHAAENSGLGHSLFSRPEGGGPDPLGGFVPARVAAMFGRRDEVFALCVVVLSAKLAKCDGVVNRSEIAAFKQHFRIPPSAAGDIGRLFDQARDSADGFEGYASQLGETFADAPSVLEEVLAALFAIARADGQVTPAEARFLQTTCHRLGLGERAWYRAAQLGAQPPQKQAVDALAEAYDLLGLPRSASDDALRARWVHLMRENHPDSLASRGVPADLIEKASGRVATINAAWDRIKRERGL